MVPVGKVKLGAWQPSFVELIGGCLIPSPHLQEGHPRILWMIEEFMRLKDGTLLTAEPNKDATLGGIFSRPLTDEEPDMWS